MQPSGALEAVLYTDDLSAARKFYEGVLGLTLHSQEPGRHLFFRVGETMFLVFNAETTLRETVAVDGHSIGRHGARGPGHIAFRIGVEELDQWRDRLTAKSIVVESVINWPNGGRSIYFRDPAGNSVELATAKLWGMAER